MLKRIVILGENKDLLDQTQKLANENEVIVEPLEKGVDLPPAATAALGDASDVESAWEIALTLGSQQEEVLYLLSEAIDCRESFLPGSSKRVAEHATRFAQAIGLNRSDQAALERAALLRDIGKIHLPNEALLKDGVLEYEEWILVQTHPHIGADMMENLGSLKDTAEIIRHHHECYDGDGYPGKLEGENIPYLARALKILDVYCAMTSPRHYREGHASHEEAVEHLESEHGKHFDPHLVDAFIKNNVGQTPDE